jgi:hypothetical protein
MRSRPVALPDTRRYVVSTSKPLRTKWEILSEALEEARNTVQVLEQGMRDLEAKPFGSECSYCGTEFATEADFDRHFIITNERHLNLGECPRKLKALGLL